MSKAVLDTVLIDVRRGRDAVRAFLLEVTRHAVFCCSVISVSEPRAGMRPAETRALPVRN